MEKEEWRDVKDYEGIYQVSSFGRIKSLDRIKEYKRGDKVIKSVVKGTLIKTFLFSWGYEGFVASKFGRTTTKYIHKVIAESFIPNPDNKKMVNHKDLNKLNNRIDNLEWCTHKENIQHYFKQPHVKGSNAGKFGKDSHQIKAVIQYTLDGEFIKEYPSVSSVGFELGINISGIYKNCTGKSSKSNGYKWKYKNEHSNNI